MACLQLFFVLTVLCAPILLPLNATARAGTDQPGPPPNTTDFLTVSNVPAESPALWAHLALLYLASIFVLYWTSRTYRHVWALRHDYLAERAKVLHPEEYTVLVTDIPEPPRLAETSAVHLVIPRQVPKCLIHNCEGPTASLRGSFRSGKQQAPHGAFGLQSLRCGATPP